MIKEPLQELLNNLRTLQPLISKSKMIKESIRLSYSDLGDFYSNRGNLPEVNFYIKIRIF
jgi:hypothetical protein